MERLSQKSGSCHGIGALERIGASRRRSSPRASGRSQLRSGLRLLIGAVVIPGCLAIVGCLAIANAQDKPVESATTRRAIQRALPFLEKEGVAWMQEKSCASCHNVPFLLWSHNEARARGVAVDERKLAEWTDWTWTFSKTRREWFKLSNDIDAVLPPEVSAKLKPIVTKPFSAEKELVAELAKLLTQEELNQYQGALTKQATRPPEPMNDGGGLDTLSQVLLGRAPGDKTGNAPEFLADMQNVIIRWQQPDGAWKAAGQLPLQNRPQAETDAVTTMWAVLALASINGRGPEADKALERALQFLRNLQPGETNESLVTAFLVERTFGQVDRVTALLKEILSRQNRDGGWGWRQGNDSDAFATGQALYALSKSGLPLPNTAIPRARDYLIKSQAEDGSWLVSGTAISRSTNEARLKKVAPIYRYWGTAWAVIGLSHTLEETNAAQASQNSGE